MKNESKQHRNSISDEFSMKLTVAENAFKQSAYQDVVALVKYAERMDAYNPEMAWDDIKLTFPGMPRQTWEFIISGIFTYHAENDDLCLDWNTTAAAEAARKCNDIGNANFRHLGLGDAYAS